MCFIKTHYIFRSLCLMTVEILFLNSSFASTSQKTYEKGREIAGETTLSKCHNKAEKTAYFTHKTICKIHVLYLRRQV